MVGAMKQNLVMIVPNMLLMGWITYFFSGFILVKLPFPLTDRFKQMLQRGVSLGGLDVSYVSSLSWYFVNLFGLRGLFACVLGSDSAGLDNAEVMAQQMQGGMGQMGQADPSKLFESVTHTTHRHHCPRDAVCLAISFSSVCFAVTHTHRAESHMYVCLVCASGEKNELEIVQVCPSHTPTHRTRSSARRLRPSVPLATLTLITLLCGVLVGCVQHEFLIPQAEQRLLSLPTAA